MAGEQIYHFPDGSDSKVFFYELKKKYHVYAHRARISERNYYDTFDWRVYKQDLLLYVSGNHMYLQSTKVSPQLISVELRKMPRFVPEIPAGILKKTLQPILEMRALQKLIQINMHAQQLRIIDTNDKTVVQISLEQYRGIVDRAKIKKEALRLIPVRGYPKFFAEFSKWLKTYGCRPDEKDLFFDILTAAGLKPGGYTSKINVHLSKDMDILQASGYILENLLSTMRQNEKGVVEDIDTEFLHDFRVAVRRTRSVYGQFKNVFSDTISNRAKKDFRYLGDLTNKMRDIDVYLLKESYYKEQLPFNMQTYIDSFFSKLRRDRVSELSKLRRHLRSKRYEETMLFWQNFVQSSSREKAESLSSVTEFAKFIILKRFNRVIRLGRKIDAKSPDTMLHKLRIEGKKLRYLLEFFISLFPEEQMSLLVKFLKNLQDNLGEFNDLSVQQSTLQDFVNTLPASSEKSKNEILAIGVLVGKLNIKQTEMRNSFASIFKRFADEKTRKLFIELFEREPGRTV